MITFKRGKEYYCKTEAVVQRDGKWYCDHHDPVSVERRMLDKAAARVRSEAARSEKAKAKYARDRVILALWPKVVDAINEAICTGETSCLYKVSGKIEEIEK